MSHKRSSFHLFKLLRTELRESVWEQHLLTERQWPGSHAFKLVPLREAQKSSINDDRECFVYGVHDILSVLLTWDELPGHSDMNRHEQNEVALMLYAMNDIPDIFRDTIPQWTIHALPGNGSVWNPSIHCGQFTVTPECWETMTLMQKRGQIPQRSDTEVMRVYHCEPSTKANLPIHINVRQDLVIITGAATLSDDSNLSVNWAYALPFIALGTEDRTRKVKHLAVEFDTSWQRPGDPLDYPHDDWYRDEAKAAFSKAKRVVPNLWFIDRRIVRIPGTGNIVRKHRKVFYSNTGRFIEVRMDRDGNRDWKTTVGNALWQYKSGAALGTLKGPSAFQFVDELLNEFSPRGLGGEILAFLDCGSQEYRHDLENVDDETLAFYTQGAARMGVLAYEEGDFVREVQDDDEGCECEECRAIALDEGYADEPECGETSSYDKEELWPAPVGPDMGW
ncbi:hypothetical protein QBC40DRAFT_301156 [Triangularia verruculosa]|uniref:Uncharacterized protein n=1 Tax=Triangularia verruculosa TaxID=2587418 RepID=A0AAN7AQD3_9PEZI|nr:hypothetical protein QBC40DRAFT_301156 [Triangularia verruculosa]